jgi:hypothetical protein
MATTQPERNGTDRAGVVHRPVPAYLGGLLPVGDLRQAKVNALREPHNGTMLQSATGEE